MNPMNKKYARGTGCFTPSGETERTGDTAMSEIPSPFPAAVRKIGIAAPSKRPDPEQLRRALEMLKSTGVETVCAPDMLAEGEEDYFASDAETRANGFNALLRDRSIDLILCSRGGYGSGYLLDRIDWPLLAERNLPVCGYSDITALHMGMLAHHAGIPVTSPMAETLLRAGSDSFTSMQHAVGYALKLNDGSKMTARLTRVTEQMTAKVTGHFIAANLAVLTSLCGSKHLPRWTGAVLAVEDIDEEPRKIDRMLLQLDLCGIFDEVSAVVFGKFSGACGTPEERDRIFRRFAARHPRTAFFKG